MSSFQDMSKKDHFFELQMVDQSPIHPSTIHRLSTIHHLSIQVGFTPGIPKSGLQSVHTETNVQTIKFFKGPSTNYVISK